MNSTLQDFVLNEFHATLGPHSSWKSWKPWKKVLTLESPEISLNFMKKLAYQPGVTQASALCAADKMVTNRQTLLFYRYRSWKPWKLNSLSKKEK